MKVCVIGANGQLGSDLCEIFRQDELFPLNHADIEIRDESQCYQVLESIRPDFVINTASYHNVPLCEERAQEAMSVNILGAKNLACACDRLKTSLIHYSTDYVFDGLKSSPYIESDRPNPLNVYAITKLAGEHVVQSYCENHKVLRVSGIYGKIPCRAKGTNFVATMLKLARQKTELDVVNDEVLTPTHTLDIARQTRDLIVSPETGIFHVSNAGQCSWYEFAAYLFECLGMDIIVNPVSSDHFPSTVKRPKWSVLENARLKELSIYRMPHWKEALKAHLERIATSNGI